MSSRSTGGPSRPLPAGSDQVLAKRYDVALLDLDGVVYVGPKGVPGAAEALDEARGAGMRLAFVTNNASRTPEAVAAHLRDLGVNAAVGEVVTSAQAACRVLAERFPDRGRVLVVGGEGLRQAARDRGFTVVDHVEDEPIAVVQGFSQDIGWRHLAEAAVAVRRGAFWLATNLDLTIPSERGPVPGNGALVTVVRLATGVEPAATGKPDPSMHLESVDRTGARQPIVVGDRLDTDIEGATRVGCDSLLVLTGVTTAADLLAARPEHRPTYVAAGLAGLLVPHPAPSPGDGGSWTCQGWTVRPAGADLALQIQQDPPERELDPIDALRALCAAAWSAPDSPDGVRPVGPAATAAAERLGLAGR